MSRTTQDAAITTRAARERLAERHEPHWRHIEGGLSLGYRKGRLGGVWVARLWVNGHYQKRALGRVDDVVAATVGPVETVGSDERAEVLDFRQAQASAVKWAARVHRVAAGLESERPNGAVVPYTVSQAMEAYLADYAARGGKSVASTRFVAAAHILPALGHVAVSRLTREKVRGWHRALAASPGRLRAKTGQMRHREVSQDPDASRRRRSSANRIMTILKAALNHAKAEGRVACPSDAWDAAKAFREADAPKIRYLSDAEITRLIKACSSDFQELVSAALLTGARYGELAAMQAGDFDAQAGTVTVGLSKSGRPRHIVLTDEGVEFFSARATGKMSAARLFERHGMVRQATRTQPAQTSRVAWGKSHQCRYMGKACLGAAIEPAISFHDLRHTYASRLAVNGAPMSVIAAQLGHSGSRMTERHYAHLAPSYVAKTVRASFGDLGIIVKPDAIGELTPAADQIT